ncbi:GlcG/HbpS family heme-binding protein [Acidocella sp.]|uniref:GlcG/HbpS family heme-binding protein n=1 Tax=Acidocella sp. TaxID=50710 RepID=UPI003CFC3356
MPLSLENAQKIINGALAYAKAQELKPLVVAVLDARGALKALAAQDGTSLKRGEIALGKANGALALGMGTRALMKRAEQQPYFINAATAAIGGSLVPVPGGVLIKQGGAVIGVVGVSGDTSDNDEAAAVAGIIAISLDADGG